MKLIDESKIADGSNQAYLKLKHNAYFGNGFQSGVYFAENELKTLAIEFAKWLNDNYDMTENKHEWSDWTEIHTTEKCFELFLEWRKKQF